MDKQEFIRWMVLGVILLLIPLLFGCSEEYYIIGSSSNVSSNVSSYWFNQSDTTINTSYNTNTNGLITCYNGSATIMTRNVTLSQSYGCTV